MDIKKEVILGKIVAYPTHNEVDIAMESLYQNIKDSFSWEPDCIITTIIDNRFIEFANKFGVNYLYLDMSTKGIDSIIEICRKERYATPLVIFADNSTAQLKFFRDMVGIKWSFLTACLFKNSKIELEDDYYGNGYDFYGEEYEGDKITLPPEQLKD